MMEKQNGCTFWLKIMTYEKNIKLFGIKVSADIKKNYSEPIKNF